MLHNNVKSTNVNTKIYTNFCTCMNYVHYIRDIDTRKSKEIFD